MRTSVPHIALIVCLIVGIFSVSGIARADSVHYLYDLSDFTGTIPYSDVKLFVDLPRDEVYAALGNTVRLFNSSGMEIYRFDLDPGYGTVFDLAVTEEGDILLLTVHRVPGKQLPGWEVTRCDYRGTPIGRIDVTGLPAELDSFVPNLMGYHDGEIILASGPELRVVVANQEGAFERAYDLAALTGVPDDRRSDNDLFGFGVDPRGNILFTMATKFKAFVLSPDGAVASFGRAGSVPGSFGIASGIASDGHGHIFVADRLRGVVLVFDDKMQFVTEFGDGTNGRVVLMTPRDLVSGDDGKVYVTQGREIGVAVFRLDSGGGEFESNADAERKGGGGSNGSVDEIAPPVGSSKVGGTTHTGSADPGTA